MGRKQVGGHAGMAGSVFVGGNELCVTNWSLSEMATEEEITGSCSGGFEEYEYGPKHAEGSVTADWDVTRNPFDNPPDFNPGQKYAIKLYLFASPGVGNENGPYWDLYSCGISNITVTCPAKGKLTYEFSFKTSGSYAQPTGNLASSGA